MSITILIVSLIFVALIVVAIILVQSHHILFSGGYSQHDPPQVIYLPTTHNPKSDNPRIKHCLDQNPEIDLILVEGLPYSLGINPDAKLDGEFGFATKLAQDRNIDWAGIEDSDKSFIKQLISIYSLQDVSGYLYLRELKIHLRQSPTHNHTDKQFIDFMKFVYDYYQIPDFTSGVDKWFMLRFSSTIMEMKRSVLKELAAPANTQYITQQISLSMSEMRNAASMRNIEHAKRTYKYILCIMGKDHIREIRKK